MKKLLLTVSSVMIFGLGMNAQIVFQEDFDGVAGPTAGGPGTYSFPSGWLLRNVDNRTPDANVAYVNEAWERREDFSFNVADSCAFSTSWYSPVGAADDWMWTPLIGPVPANAVLNWNAVTYDASFRDGYEVRIMTAAQGPPTGGTGVMGNQVTNSTVLFSTTAENASWTSRSVSLSAYAGQSVYIAFRNNSTDKFLLLIDDVTVQVQVNLDAELLFADTATEYTLIPQTQTGALNFNGTIRNNGLNALSNVSARVNVYEGVTNVYTTNSAAVASLASGATTTWTATAYTPTTPGIYTVEFIAMQTSGTDQVPTNDTMWQQFIVTDSTYARDDGSVTGSLGIGAGNGGYLGQSYQITNSDLLTSIGMYVTAGYTGRRMALVGWNTNGVGVPTTIAFATDTMLYPDDSARYYQFTLANGPVLLNPGTYVITAIEFDSTLALGTTNSVHTNNRTWINWPTSPFGTWANNEDFAPQFAKPFVIRPNFGDVCLNNTATATSTQASCLTCADGTAMVTTSGTDGSLTYAWAPAGGNAPSATGLLTGSYTVTVTDGFGCVTMDTVFVNYDVCGLLSGTASSTDASCAVCPDGSAQVVITGNNGPLTYLWSNGGTADTIQNVLPGTYYVTTTDSLGCSRVDSVIVDFSLDIAGINAPGAISIFPNPSTGVFAVNVNLAASSDITVFVTNTLGEVVATKTVNGMQNGRIDMNVDLAAGAYNLHVRSADAEKVIPMNIQK
jgi:hypothetical protein